MAKMNKKTEGFPVSKTIVSTSGNVPSVETSKPSGPQIPVKTISGDKRNNTPSLTHKQVEERANAIWRQKGCPVGQDEKNWREAETQLKQELSIR
jgi:hypothetical protein